MREVLGLAGIYDPTTFRLIPDAVYGTSKLANFIAHIDAHHERLAQLFDKSANEHLHERPASQVATLLGLMGLKQKQVKANKGGNRGGSTYKIDETVYETMMKIVTTR